MSTSSPQRTKLLVLWTIWFGMVCSIIFCQFKLGGGLLRGEDVRSAVQNPILWICIGWLLAAAIVRWWFIPRTRDMQRLLVVLIIGLALSEAVTFHSIFLFPADMPQTKMCLFELSLVSALQFIPLYALDAAPGPMADQPPEPTQS